MNATINDETIIPSLLGEMAGQVANAKGASNQKHADYLAYVAGWIRSVAEKEYKQLLARDGLPTDARVVKLLCELAVMRALVRWHEVRDKPPPMPSIDAIS